MVHWPPLAFTCKYDVCVVYLSLLFHFQLSRLFGDPQSWSKEPDNNPRMSKAQKDAENTLTKSLTNSDNFSHVFNDEEQSHAGSALTFCEESTSSGSTVPCMAPPAPPLPPVPPPPPPKTITRLPQSQIHWMKKPL